MFYCAISIYIVTVTVFFGEITSRFTSRRKRDRALGRFYRKVSYKLDSASELRDIFKNKSASSKGTYTSIAFPTLYFRSNGAESYRIAFRNK